jgi:phosphate transport system permease protein
LAKDSRVQLDKAVWSLLKVISASCGALLLVIGYTLIVKAAPLLESVPLSDLLLSSRWFPTRGEYGFLAFMVGTLVVTLMAMALAAPVSLLTAIYLSEYASRRVRDAVKPLIDILAGIPSVVYGLWGVAFVVPTVRVRVAPLFGVSTTGYCVLSAGVVLAIMVFPLIISVAEEVLRAVPQSLRETAFSLGATRWQTVKHVVLREASVGVRASVILGFTRAIGETMAVLMVVGNVAKVPGSLFDAAYPLPSLIANNYGEMMSLPMYESALMFAALLLLLAVAGFTVFARALPRRIARLGR